MRPGLGVDQHAEGTDPRRYDVDLQPVHDEVGLGLDVEHVAGGALGRGVDRREGTDRGAGVGVLGNGGVGEEQGRRREERGETPPSWGRHRLSECGVTCGARRNVCVSDLRLWSMDPPLYLPADVYRVSTSRTTVSGGIASFVSSIVAPPTRSQRFSCEVCLACFFLLSTLLSRPFSNRFDFATAITPTLHRYLFPIPVQDVTSGRSLGVSRVPELRERITSYSRNAEMGGCACAGSLKVERANSHTPIFCVEEEQLRPWNHADLRQDPDG